MFRTAVLAGIISLTILPALAGAAILTVRQDGSGDYLTIIDAVQAAAAGDTVEVGPGTYGDSVSVEVPLTILSTDGPEATVVYRSHNWWINAGPTRIEGLKFERLYYVGSSLRIDGVEARIVNCSFYRNSAGEYGWGGAILIRDGAVAEIERCRFESNFAREGAAVMVATGSQATIRQCVFYDNRSSNYCGGVTAKNATLDVIDCLFDRNYAFDSVFGYGVDGPGALKYESSTGSVTGCTFYKNILNDVAMYSSPTVPVEKCIFYGTGFSMGGIGYYYVTGPRSCNIYWRSTVWPDAFEPDEFVIDPRFCDADEGDFSVSVTSAAAPEYSPCGELIGAYAPACTLGSEPPVPWTFTVRQDGSGDYTDIATAMSDVHWDGMTIEIGPVVYSRAPGADWFEIDKTITFRSTDGAAATVIDGGPMFWVYALGKTVKIEGLTLRDAADPVHYQYQSGPALTVRLGDVRVEGCVFEDNVGRNGGAVYAEGKASRIWFSGCEFTNNVAADSLTQITGLFPGGAVYAREGAQIHAHGCSFSGNRGMISALAAFSAHLEIDSCLFVDNHAYAGAETSIVAVGYGAVAFLGSSGSVTRSTFYSNQSPALGPGFPAGTVLIRKPPAVSIERNIFAGDTNGAGIFYYSHSPYPRSCNVFWDNGRGAVVNDELKNDEITADPLFCDPASGDFTLSENSPAAPRSGACASLAGAYPVGCNPVPVTVFFQAEAADGGVDLFWDIASDVNLAGCWLRRERIEDGQIVRLPETGLFDHTAGGHADVSPALGYSYNYTLIAVDDVGAQHTSYEVSVNDGYLEILRFAASSGPLGIDLEWEIDASETLAGYYLRREDPTGGGDARIPAQGLFASGDTGLTDTNIELDREYYYYLTAVDRRQNEHGSEAVQVTSLPFIVDSFRGEAILERIALSWEVSSVLSPLQCQISREDLVGGEIDLLPPAGYLDAAVDTGYVDESVEAGRQYRYTLFVWTTPQERYETRSVEVGAGFLVVGEFSAEDYPGGVKLEWDVTASDSLLGCYLNRYDPASEQTTRLPAAGLLDVDAGTYLDEQTSQNAVYQYSLVVVDWQSGEHAAATSELKTAFYPYGLSQNQPNPFNPGTLIPYSINEQVYVTLVVYDVLGRHVRTLIDRDQLPGAYSETWDGTNQTGGTVASGVYLYRLRAGAFEQTRKMTILR